MMMMMMTIGVYRQVSFWLMRTEYRNISGTRQRTVVWQVQTSSTRSDFLGAGQTMSTNALPFLAGYLSRSRNRRFHSFSLHQRRTKSYAKIATMSREMNSTADTRGYAALISRWRSKCSTRIRKDDIDIRVVQ